MFETFFDLHRRFWMGFPSAQGAIAGCPFAAVPLPCVFPQLRFGIILIPVINPITETYIQLSFMPSALASDPNKTVFYNPFNTSPPKDMNEWNLLIRNFVQRLIAKFGFWSRWRSVLRRYYPPIAEQGGPYQRVQHEDGQLFILITK